jgi:hypothetical protein
LARDETHEPPPQSASDHADKVELLRRQKSIRQFGLAASDEVRVPIHLLGRQRLGDNDFRAFFVSHS